MDVITQDFAQAHLPPKTRSSKCQRSGLQIIDPSTPEGQTLGAYLVIKRKVADSNSTSKFAVQVGDIFQFKDNPDKAGRMIVALNIRTGVKASVFWLTVFPVGKRELCGCHERLAWGSDCRCIYEEFEKSKVSFPKIVMIKQ